VRRSSATVAPAGAPRPPLSTWGVCDRPRVSLFGLPRRSSRVYGDSVPAPPILLIRHAESEWNAAGRWQGHGDPPLSERGREQAGSYASNLANSRIDVLISSDLRRAVETAAVVGGALGLEPLRDAGLRELDVGAWEGLTRSEITRRHPLDLAAFDRGDPGARPTGGETLVELETRVRAALSSLVERHFGKRLAVITHLGVIRVLADVAEIDHAHGCWIDFDCTEPAARAREAG
jgi:broad specificity phosphatase PhoE